MSGVTPAASGSLRRRRVVLVELYWTRDKDPRVPLGQASLHASLNREQHLDLRALAIPVNPRCNAEQVADAISQAVAGTNGDDVDVAFGAYVWSTEIIREVMAICRRSGFMGRFIVGGPEVSYSGPGLEQLFPDAGVFVRGYGEDALRELCRSNERRPIAGVHWAGTLDVGGHAQVVFDEMRSPWLDGLIGLSEQPFVRWETQRGCTFQCSFCQHRNPDAKPMSRPFGRERISAEIAMFCESNVCDIAVLDPIFNAKRDHAVWVLQEFARRGYRGRLSLQCRAECITPEFVAVAAKLDTRLEFGLQTIHKNEGRAVKRHNNVPKVAAALNLVREAGIDHEVSLIFGLPQQTLASFEESIQWCLDQRIPTIKAFPLLLLRGTPLEAERAVWGLEVDPDSAMPTVIRANSFTSEEWAKMNKLSAALKDTEGGHPSSVSHLWERAKSLDPDGRRWAPVGDRGGVK